MERALTCLLCNPEIFIDANTSQYHTYASVKQTASLFGSYLQQHQSWQKSDVLAFFTPNAIDVPPLVWGCHYAGGIVTTANPAYTPNELEFQLRNSEARALVTHESCVEVAKKAAKGAGIVLDRIWLLGEGKVGARQDGIRNVQDLLGGMDAKQLRPRVRASTEDLAFLVYSSGTTGLPKGVMLSHRNIIANVLQLSHELQQTISNDDLAMARNPTVSFLPFYHIYGESSTCYWNRS